MNACTIPLPWKCLLFLVLISSASCYRGSEKEATLAIIKPDGVLGNYTEAIKAAILRSGFKISQEKIVQLDEGSASSFYAEHSTKKFFHSLVKYMTSGPVLAMVLEKENAVSDWRTLIGPTDGSKAKITHPNSIRAMCGTDVEKNCVHGSDSSPSAEREISFFFDTASGEKEVEHDERYRGEEVEHDEL